MSIKQVLLILGIALIFTVFFGYAAEVVFEQPEYPNDKCSCYPNKPMSQPENDAYYRSQEYLDCQKQCTTSRMPLTKYTHLSLPPKDFLITTQKAGKLSSLTLIENTRKK